MVMDDSLTRRQVEMKARQVKARQEIMASPVTVERGRIKPRRIAKRVIQPLSTMHFTKAMVTCLTGPVVYIFRDGDDIAYVGASRSGISRPFNRNHLADPLRCEITVLSCATWKDACTLETKLIRLHKPAGNQVCKHMKHK